MAHWLGTHEFSDLGGGDGTVIKLVHVYYSSRIRHRKEIMDFFEIINTFYG
jgi:hypothetical protein